MYLCVGYHLYRQLSIFNTHLSTILKKCLNDYYYSENGVSKYYQQEYYNIGKFKESYERDHGYKPTDKEIRDHFCYNEARYSAILFEALALNNVSLLAPIFSAITLSAVVLPEPLPP